MEECILHNSSFLQMPRSVQVQVFENILFKQEAPVHISS